MNIIEITDANFKNTIAENKVTIVDFWAPWCNPCKILLPTMEAIAEELKGKVKIVKINLDDNPKTPVEYNIRTIPTVLFFKDGNLVERFSGVKPKNEILAIVDSRQAL